MKLIGYLLHLVSIAWLLTVGLHALAHLLRPITGVPHALRWFWHLPLPVSVMNPWHAWPMLLGMAGVITGAMLVNLGRRAEKKRLEGSEA